jgi:hypothetical protein
MTLQLNFTYYRNFRFDGKFHVRCSGADLPKVSRIRYELERVEPEGIVRFAGVSTHSQVASGKLEEHGCKATLFAEPVLGTYHIRPRVVLMDAEAIAMNRPTGAAGVFDLEPLVIEIKAGELSRSILDSVPLPGSARRRKREVDEVPADPWGDALPPFFYPEQGARYPAVVLKFQQGGLATFIHNLDTASGSLLARTWPGLQPLIALQPLVAEDDDGEVRKVLGEYCTISQPETMGNDIFVELLKTLAALDYLETMYFQGPKVEEGFLLWGASALVATLLTGGAVVLGNRANENAKPTPDFEPEQKYLDAPSSISKGLNIRAAWQKQVTGRGARIHFSDGGLFPGHEDLRDNPNLKLVTSQPNDDPNHGTASSGVMLATRNGIGVTGISHDCELYLYDNRATDSNGQSLTLKRLLKHVAPGDIVGINRQTANAQALYTVLPSLHDQMWWDVCKELSERGAVVVNAAGNGSSKSDSALGIQAGYGVDLSRWPLFNNHGEADVILVGACHSWDGKPHQYSNYNFPYRMLNAWGDSVVTLGYGASQDKPGNDRDYTHRYAGTSSATPMVAGALCLIQSYAMEQHHVYLNGDQMHLLVMASGYQDATLPHEQRLPMGARPNVHGALVLLDRILGGGRFFADKDEL